MDLTDNKTPFGLLTPEEQEHLRNWPHGVEVWRLANDGLAVGVKASNRAWLWRLA